MKRASTGWDAPVVVNHPKRPDPASLRITDARRQHVLDGDPSGSGGHRHGTGRPTKTEFPARWDDDATMAHVLDVARHPDEPPVMQQNGNWYTHGVRDGVDVVAAIHPTGQIVTAYPLEGGHGVVKNPRRGAR